MMKWGYYGTGHRVSPPTSSTVSTSSRAGTTKALRRHHRPDVEQVRGMVGKRLRYKDLAVGQLSPEARAT